MNITDALDSTNTPLYDSLSRHTKIHFLPNDNWHVNVWYSVFHGKESVIYYSPVACPQAQLSRQLLFLELQCNGYRRVLDGLSLLPDTNQWMQTIVKSIDTCLQNQKIANRWLAMGYDLEQLLYEDDADIFEYFEQMLAMKGYSEMYLLTSYWGFTNPLLNVSANQRKYLHQKFCVYAGGKLRTRLLETDSLLFRWANVSAYEAKTYVLAMANILGIKQDTWLSYEYNKGAFFEEQFPQAGFFVGQPFGLEQVRKVYS
ncbi:hypothetical protein SAMN05421780_101683 [Flexibacter flexilis DSM 6793]|uniref:Uncharacterized protein n=1 Tax=Flexibacter flexilis DSM 6793 TaxID=927664 RepID=A0A1I1E833_9BACT|nr:hypothetical protein [Flexibacter flexilis]SFB83319.1 hypothetical protein SAMN05421780_101683 [Flexibacter flexilis DSM 6793]